MADTVVEELAASCIWKKENERFGKRRTQPVITFCASDLAWLLQRFVFSKVRIVWQSYQQGIVLFLLSLSLSLSLSLLLSILAFLPAGLHAVIEIFMDQVFSFPLTYHLPLRHFLLTFFQRMNNLEKANPHKSKKDDENYIHRNKKDRTHKQAMRFFCLLFYRKPTLSHEVCWASQAPVTSLVTHTRIAVRFHLVTFSWPQTPGRKPQVDIQFVSDPGLIFKNIRPGRGRGLISGG